MVRVFGNKRTKERAAGGSDKIVDKFGLGFEVN